MSDHDDMSHWKQKIREPSDPSVDYYSPEMTYMLHNNFIPQELTFESCKDMSTSDSVYHMIELNTLNHNLLSIINAMKQQRNRELHEYQSQLDYECDRRKIAEERCDELERKFKILQRNFELDLNKEKEEKKALQLLLDTKNNIKQNEIEQKGISSIIELPVISLQVKKNSTNFSSNISTSIYKENEYSNLGVKNDQKILSSKFYEEKKKPKDDRKFDYPIIKNFDDDFEILSEDDKFDEVMKNDEKTTYNFDDIPITSKKKNLTLDELIIEEEKKYNSQNKQLSISNNNTPQTTKLSRATIMRTTRLAKSKVENKNEKIESKSAITENKNEKVEKIEKKIEKIDKKPIVTTKISNTLNFHPIKKSAINTTHIQSHNTSIYPQVNTNNTTTLNNTYNNSEVPLLSTPILQNQKQEDKCTIEQTIETITDEKKSAFSNLMNNFKNMLTKSNDKKDKIIDEDENSSKIVNRNKVFGRLFSNTETMNSTSDFFVNENEEEKNLISLNRYNVFSERRNEQKNNKLNVSQYDTTGYTLEALEKEIRRKL